jgi:hypothetical protein
MFTTAIARPPSTYISFSSFFAIQYTWEFHLSLLLCIVYICVRACISFWLINLYLWLALIFLFSRIYCGFTPLRHRTSRHYTSRHQGFLKWYSLAFSSLDSLSQMCKYVRSTNMATKLPQLYPYHVSQYWMIFYLVWSIHVKKKNNLMFTQVSTQHPFICATNTLGERNWDLYVIFEWCWLHTIHAWPTSFESSIPRLTWVWKINVAFSMLTFTMCSITLFLINLCFFILTIYM